MIINKKKISNNSKTYFIADIAANHDGDIKKAFELIYQAKKSGADAAKFQHFSAETIVSDKSFSSMKSKLSHQSKWKKSVFQVYKDASLNLDWTPKLYNYCKKIGIDFFTSPYSIDLVDHVDKFVPAYKIGSGDITWLEIIKHISKKKKPVILASGASNMQDVVRAIKTIKKYNSNICIMQCNTNYTASEENFNYINLNVLKSYRKKFKNIILGLSDHTLGHSTVLGAISLGAKIIEKHFTLSNNDQGPDQSLKRIRIIFRIRCKKDRKK
jgi:N-acetylneuraminate synthase